MLSTGGFTGNLFHDYTGVLIPAFITAHSYVGEVQFLMSSFHSSPVACSAVRPAAAAAVGCVYTVRQLGYWRATYGRLIYKKGQINPYVKIQRAYTLHVAPK